uniref:TLDc domain-containing protein n=1 Tax=Bursaphelenchus xylophilus TaxID=6326 RepID=A0A1I7RKK0_BURXY
MYDGLLCADNGFSLGGLVGNGFELGCLPGDNIDVMDWDDEVFGIGEVESMEIQNFCNPCKEKHDFSLNLGF